MAASVCITLGIENIAFWLGTVLLIALIIPLDILNSCPKGLPITIVWFPTLTFVESPRFNGVKIFPFEFTLIIAKSEFGSSPITEAGYCDPSENSTSTIEAFATTW